MRPAIVLACFLLMAAACKKSGDKITISSINGTWKYIGYSGGLAGFKLTGVEHPFYIAFKDATRQYTITEEGGYTFCGSYTLDYDSLYHTPLVILDRKLLSDSLYEISFKENQLRLYPHYWADAFMYHFEARPESLKACNKSGD
ncbi:MAG: hypothetical protein QM731_18130 [Chitinophagaceae bacterium]